MQNQKTQTCILITGMLLCIAAVGVAQLKILTYVSGQDPFMYLRLANRMAAAGSLGEVFQQLKTAPFLPAYPVLLALSIKTCGSFAPYWVNFILFIGMIPVLGFLLRFLLKDTWASVIGLLAVCLVVLGGYPLNAHFLLYPFRGLPAMFFMLAGLAMFYRGIESDRHGLWLLVSAGFCFMLAILMREPSVFAVVGPVCWLLVMYKGPQQEKRLRILWFAIPWLVGFMLWLCVGMVSGKMVSPQFSSWSQIMVTLGPLNLLRQFFVNAGAMLRFLPDEFGWILFILLILGIWSQRRNARLLAAFLVPALLFFVFYAIYESHRRYFLNVILFSAVFIGPGTMFVIDRFRKVLPWAVRIWLPVVPVTVLTVWLGFVVGELKPWGPTVPLEQARQLRETLALISHPGNSILIDPRCRYMVDAIVSLTDLQVAHPRAAQRLLSEGRHCLFADPLNEACYYKGDSLHKYAGISGVPFITHVADLHPYKTEDRKLQVVTVGDARYGLYQVTPWTTRRVIKEVTCSSGSNRVIWLDFGNPTAACNRKVRLLDNTFKERFVWDGIMTGGIHAFLLPDTAAPCHIEVSSDCSFPLSVLAGCVANGDFMEWPLDVRRSVSIQSWFREPFLATDAESKYAAVFNQGGAIHLPVVHSTTPYKMNVRLIQSPDKQMQQDVQIAYEHNGNTLVDKRMSLAKSRIWSLLELPPTEQSELAVVLTVDPADCHANYIRIEELAIAIEKAE